MRIEELRTIQAQRRIEKSIRIAELRRIKEHTVKPLTTNTSEKFIKCCLDNFSMSFILYFVNFSIYEYAGTVLKSSI